MSGTPQKRAQRAERTSLIQLVRLIEQSVRPLPRCGNSWKPQASDHGVVGRGGHSVGHAGNPASARDVGELNWGDQDLLVKVEPLVMIASECGVSGPTPVPALGLDGGAFWTPLLISVSGDERSRAQSRFRRTRWRGHAQAIRLGRLSAFHCTLSVQQATRSSGELPSDCIFVQSLR